MHPVIFPPSKRHANIPTIALQQFRDMLYRGRVAVVGEEVSDLLDLLLLRDQTMRLADQLEATMAATIGYPRIIVKAGENVRAVASQDLLTQLVEDGTLSEADGEWLGRRLARRQHQWWQQASELGLRGLRRRERSFALHASQLADRILAKRPATLVEITGKLALLAAAQAPERRHVIGLLDDVAALD